MGYYITIESEDIFLDKKYFTDVYARMCELNDHDELKRGGSFGSNNDAVDGERYSKNKWFSWMSYNYPDTCPDMESILAALGFDTDYDSDGNLVGLRYSDKTGSEDYFLSCFAGFIKAGSYIEFSGEETEDYYRYLFDDKNMFLQQGVMTVTYEEVGEQYEFGKMTKDDKEMAEYRKKLTETVKDIEVKQIG